MYIITTVIVKISKEKTKRLTVGKKSVRNLIYLVSSWIFSHVSFDFEAYVVVAFGLKKEMYLLAAKIPPRCPPCCLLWFSREQNARVHLTFSLNEMYGYSRLCDRLRSFAIIWKPALTYSTDYYQRITLESWFTNSEQTALNRCQPGSWPFCGSMKSP